MLLVVSRTKIVRSLGANAYAEHIEDHIPTSCSCRSRAPGHGDTHDIRCQEPHLVDQGPVECS